MIRTVTKLKKTIKLWERQCIAAHTLHAETVTDYKNDNLI